MLCAAMKTQRAPIQSQSAPPERESSVQNKRRYPVGAELIGPNETHFRVWAPKVQQLELVLEDNDGDGVAGAHSLGREPNGYFSGLIEARAGQRYRFRINRAEQL